MGRSILITGGNTKQRSQLALAEAESVSSKFDILVFDSTEKGGIDSVREIIVEASKRPFQGKIKSLIIQEAGNLSEQAQNALLKSLEEPPESTQFILTTPSKQNLLPTVTSRCVERVVSTSKTEQSSKAFENFLEKAFGDKVDLLEKASLEDYLGYWKEILNGNLSSKNLKTIHRYNKLILRALRAEKSFANKRLLALLLALEIPSEIK